MTESRYEKYVIRKPAILVKDGEVYVDTVPETDELPVWNDKDTGPRVIFSNDFIAGATTKIEYGFITAPHIPTKNNAARLTVLLNGDLDGRGT